MYGKFFSTELLPNTSEKSKYTKEMVSFADVTLAPPGALAGYFSAFTLYHKKAQCSVNGLPACLFVGVYFQQPLEMLFENRDHTKGNLGTSNCEEPLQRPQEQKQNSDFATS